MSARIKILPPQIANQIAAGEVIERPASVVKELLENAADAGCTQVHIDIGFGGLNHIIISDNGSGIIREDLPLTIAPHATSKLTQLDDLLHLDTMGFRGEALASIASISRFTLTSSASMQSQAAQLLLDETGMKIISAAHPVGTTIAVRDLFYNAPVRKKFLKSESIEYMHIEAVVKRFALSEPEISIRLSHNGKIRLALPASNNEITTASRLKKLFGKTFLDHAIRVETKQGDFLLSGWVSQPHFARSQQDKQWMYINRRSVKDKLLMHAIKVAYDPLIPTGKHPLYLLYLNISPQEVDINVHPTKHEVRFSNPRQVHDFVFATVTQALQQTHVTNTVTTKSTNLKRSIQMSGMDINWITVNQNYALLTYKREKYLVDIVRLRKDSLLFELSSLAFPWSTRPLLLPVSISAYTSEIKWTEYEPILKELGFLFQCVSFKENLIIQIQIAALPVAFPTLDLQYFFQHVFLIQPTHVQLIQLLIRAESWCLETITPEEKTQWFEHWLHLMKTEAGESYSLILNPETCEALFNA